MKLYHVALVYGTGPTPCWSNGMLKTTVKVVLRRELDNLPTDINEYCGQRITSKADYRRRKLDILGWINRQYKQQFTQIIID